MIDPLNPVASLPPAAPLQPDESAEVWKAFVAHVARIRVKPTFDAEERDYKFEIAQKVRGFLVGVRDGTAVLPAAARTVFAGSFGGHPYDLSTDLGWLSRWGTNDAPSLKEALERFPDEGASPEERFAWFAERGERARDEGKVDANKPSLLTYGSIFNFAISPESAPVLRPWAFDLLERVLGFGEKPPGADVTEMYENHLAFTHWLRERLEEEGVPARDAIDVQSLVWLAAQEHEFWLTPQPAEELLRMGGRDSALARKDGARRMAYVSMCSIYKNEGPYLQEWVEFHRLVGVERFFLYDNGSTDNHREVLAPYIEDGSVTVHDWPLFPQAQHKAYNHCLEEHALDSRWIGFIDMDEFVFSPTGQLLPEILVDYEEWPGVGVNLVQFGPCGHRKKPPGLVIENYARSVRPENRTPISSIVDPVRAERCVSTHYFAYPHRTAVDENGFPIWGAVTKSPSYVRLRANHYWTKSEEESRAKCSRPTPDDGRFRAWPDFPALRKRDEVFAQPDDAILQYVPALKQVLAKA